VAFHSRKLNSAERNYKIHDKKLLAIMEAFKEWKEYLWGEEEPVTVYTDNQNLQSFLTKKVLNKLQVRWAQELKNHNLKIVYRPGSRGGKPDALSRRPVYRPAKGARHTEQSIFKTEPFQNFCNPSKVKCGDGPHPRKPQIHKPQNNEACRQGYSSDKRITVRASHDIYGLTDRQVPAKGQTMVETGIAIGLPEGIYGRLAARSGMASKMGIAVSGGVMDVDYTREVKVIRRIHGGADCSFKAGDRIAQLVIEKIADVDAMEVDNLGTTKRGEKGFGSSDISPKRSITAKEKGVKICFLHADTCNNEFFSGTDIGYHPRLIKEREILSSAYVNAALTRTMNHSFLNKIRAAGKEDEKWQERSRELVMLRDSGKKMPDKWIEKDGLLYYKNRFYIPENESLQTEIAQGCHNSLVADTSDKKKQLK